MKHGNDTFIQQIQYLTNVLDILVEGNFTLYKEQGISYLAGSNNQVYTLKENIQEILLHHYQDLAETAYSKQIEHEQKRIEKGEQYDIQLS